MLLSTFIILCATLVISQSQRNIFVEKDKDRICNTNVCYPKCCPKGMYINTSGGHDECQFDGRILEVSNKHIYSGNDGNNTEDKNTVRDVFILPNMYQKNFHNDEDFRENAKMKMLKSGSLYINIGDVIIIPSNDYCFDYSITKAKEPELQYWIIVESKSIPPRVAAPAAMLVSSVFLALVLIVYCLLPELRNLGGKILMAYVFCLLSAYTISAAMELGMNWAETCIVFAALVYFFALASCCWMNVMSYDVFWTFRGYAKARKIHRRGEKFKFLMYCLYAFGLPLALTIIMLVLNSIDLSNTPWLTPPGIPESSCSLMGKPKLYYLYSPMLVMILCNWVFFALTVYNIKRRSKGTSVLQSSVTGSATSRNYQRNRFMVYLKLSVLLGISWIFEVMSINIEHVIWDYLSWYNIMIGFIIFMLFVFKRKVYESLKKKLSSTSSPNRKNSASSGFEPNTSTSNPDP